MKSPRVGRLAQLVRAPALQAGGPRFEPAIAHHSLRENRKQCDPLTFFDQCAAMNSQVIENRYVTPF
jgi:hypothetical protein